MLRHLLPTKLKVLLDELTDEVVKKAMITPAGSASSSGSAKKGRGQGNTLPRKKAKIEAKESEERVQNMITDWFN
jgi:ribosomal protein L12E/L44/L45/RPP1/RPP2